MNTQAAIDHLRKAGVSETIINTVKDDPHTLHAVVQHERMHALIASLPQESIDRARAIFRLADQK